MSVSCQGKDRKILCDSIDSRLNHYIWRFRDREQKLKLALMNASGFTQNRAIKRSAQVTFLNTFCADVV
jgi:predicted PolB exonuclease-like 3'-5' exonuclease